jgi:hypothetical protein
LTAFDCSAASEPQQQHDFALFDCPDRFRSVARRDFARVIGHPARDADLPQMLGQMTRAAQVGAVEADDDFSGLRPDADSSFRGDDRFSLRGHN